MRAKKFFLTVAIIALATLPVIAPRTAWGQNQYVLLDPRHGGTDPGATPDDDIACNYDSEAEAVWNISDNAYNRVFSELSQEWQVRITR
jgi:N-acetylmuramoyl-L-alanine amidase